MNWILVVVLVLNNQTSVIEIKPLNYFICSLAASSIPNKDATVDGSHVKVISAECKKATEASETPKPGRRG
jgi:hypothetical protein